MYSLPIVVLVLILINKANFLLQFILFHIKKIGRGILATYSNMAFITFLN